MTFLECLGLLMVNPGGLARRGFLGRVDSPVHEVGARPGQVVGSRTW